MVTSVEGHHYPIEKIGLLERPAHTAYVVDAEQALGQTGIDVAALHCDVLVATCRKWLRGPRATALFWLAPSLNCESEVGNTEPSDAKTAIRLGLGVAIEEALSEHKEKSSHELTAYAYRGAREFGFETISGRPPMTGALCLGVPEKSVTAIRGEFERLDIQAKWLT